VPGPARPAPMRCGRACTRRPSCQPARLPVSYPAPECRSHPKGAVRWRRAVPVP